MTTRQAKSILYLSRQSLDYIDALMKYHSQVREVRASALPLAFGYAGWTQLKQSARKKLGLKRKR